MLPLWPSRKRVYWTTRCSQICHPVVDCHCVFAYLVFCATPSSRPAHAQSARPNSKAVTYDGTPVPATYYFIRQMVLAYDHRQLRDPLYERLRTAPTEWISSQHQLVCFLVFDAEWTYQHQHKILFIPDEWTAKTISERIGGSFSPPLDGSLQLS